MTSKPNERIEVLPHYHEYLAAIGQYNRQVYNAYMARHWLVRIFMPRLDTTFSSYRLVQPTLAGYMNFIKKRGRL